MRDPSCLILSEVQGGFPVSKYVGNFLKKSRLEDENHLGAF